MKAFCIVLIFVSALLVGCASGSPKNSAASAHDAWTVFFPQKAQDVTGKLALSYELHPAPRDTPMHTFHLVIDCSPPPSVIRHEGFETDAYISRSQLVSQTGGFDPHMYRGDLIDTVPHLLK
jgi:hypothetical protein